jgi:hypothetical protein
MKNAARLPARRFVSIVTAVKSARGARIDLDLVDQQTTANGTSDIAPYMENTNPTRERSETASESRDLRHICGV